MRYSRTRTYHTKLHRTGSTRTPQGPHHSCRGLRPLVRLLKNTGACGIGLKRPSAAPPEAERRCQSSLSRCGILNVTVVDRTLRGPSMAATKQAATTEQRSPAARAGAIAESQPAVASFEQHLVHATAARTVLVVDRAP